MSQVRTEMLRMHTPDQLNGVPPLRVPTRRGYLGYLLNSREIHRTLERQPASLAPVVFNRLQHVSRDIEFISSAYDIDCRMDITPGLQYSRILDAAAARPVAFLAHWYAIQFAHSTGGAITFQALTKANMFDGWLGEFHGPESHTIDIKGHMEDLASRWDDSDKLRFLGTLKSAYHNVSRVNDTMFN